MHSTVLPFVHSFRVMEEQPSTDRAEWMSIMRCDMTERWMGYQGGLYSSWKPAHKHCLIHSTSPFKTNSSFLLFRALTLLFSMHGKQDFNRTYTYQNINRLWLWGITQTTAQILNVCDLLLKASVCWEHACKCPGSICKLPLHYTASLPLVY